MKDDKKVMTFNVTKIQYDFLKKENVNFSSLIRHLLEIYLRENFGRKYEVFKIEENKKDAK
jgi:hypothetical protein